MQNDPTIKTTIELTEREKEILRLVATGTGNKDIARQLFISSNTVKVHVRNIFAKIGAATRTEAAMYAVRMGIVPTAASLADQALSKDLPQSDQFVSTTATESSLPRGWRFRQSIAVVLVILVLGLAVSMGILLTKRSVAPPLVTTLPSSTPPSRWKKLAGMPTARSGLAVAAYENQIYAIGGETANGVTGVMQQYNAATDTWITLISKPLPVTDINAAVIGGRIYIPGGRLASGGMTDVLESYDTRRNVWERHASLPVALGEYALVAFEGKLFLFGGWDGMNVLASVYEYNPDADTWTARSPMPTARTFAAAVGAGGKIYVLGGTDKKSALAVNEVYTPEQEGLVNPWKSVKPMPSSRAHPGVSSVSDVVFVLGSADLGEPLSYIAYLPQKDEWQAFEAPPSETDTEFKLISLGDYIYAFGGTPIGKQVGILLAYRAIYNIGIPVIIK
jgi:DNA-binding CsgD family transcriptional regulator